MTGLCIDLVMTNFVLLQIEEDRFIKIDGVGPCDKLLALLT